MTHLKNEREWWRATLPAPPLPARPVKALSARRLMIGEYLLPILKLTVEHKHARRSTRNRRNLLNKYLAQ